MEPLNQPNYQKYDPQAWAPAAPGRTMPWVMHSPEIAYRGGPEALLQQPLQPTDYTRISAPPIVAKAPRGLIAAKSPTPTASNYGTKYSALRAPRPAEGIYGQGSGGSGVMGTPGTPGRKGVEGVKGTPGTSGTPGTRGNSGR